MILLNTTCNGKKIPTSTGGYTTWDGFTVAFRWIKGKEKNEDRHNCNFHPKTPDLECAWTWLDSLLWPGSPHPTKDTCRDRFAAFATLHLRLPLWMSSYTHSMRKFEATHFHTHTHIHTYIHTHSVSRSPLVTREETQFKITAWYFPVVTRQEICKEHTWHLQPLHKECQFIDDDNIFLTAVLLSIFYNGKAINNSDIHYRTYKHKHYDTTSRAYSIVIIGNLPLFFLLKLSFNNEFIFNLSKKRKKRYLSRFNGANLNTRRKKKNQNTSNLHFINTLIKYCSIISFVIFLN